MRKVALLTCLAVAACVEVPRAIRHDFAEPKPQERSNFRRGPHGEKPAVEDVPDAGGDATPDASEDEDGGAS